MGLLLLVRHGESEWNALSRLAGLTDIALSSNGVEQSREVGRLINDFKIDKAYTSELKRAMQTLDVIQSVLIRPISEIHRTHALDERDFGSFTKRDKTEILQEIGQADYDSIFKGWSIPAPGGESLENLYQRVSLFYGATLLNDIKHDKNVLVVSHHHTLRTLIMNIESLTIDEVSRLRLQNAELVIYEFDTEAKLVGKKVVS